MGSTGVILKDKLEFSVDKFLDDIKRASANAKLNIYINSTTYNDDGSIKESSMNLLDNQLIDGKKQQIIVSISSYDKENNFSHLFKWVDSSKELLRIAFIELIDSNERLLYQLIYELFRISPNSYLWLDGYKWVYTFKTLEKLRELPFDSEWCYKNPNLL
ncbi:MAG: hypothetical protein GX660_27990 [Clostridiaceae bacterium]|nr:hypothetical protein [Clostridiaceae bacterium]